MSRFHVHVNVSDLSRSVAFYSAMFGAEPSRLEADYAKWMLGGHLNFAISARGAQPGVDHLGFQVETDEELAALKARAQAADMSLLDPGETTCCYARSDKYWLTDPDGVAWEQFRTLASVPTFSEASKPVAPQATTCCAPRGKPVGVAIASAPSSCC